MAARPLTRHSLRRSQTVLGACVVAAVSIALPVACDNSHATQADKPGDKTLVQQPPKDGEKPAPTPNQDSNSKKDKTTEKKDGVVFENVTIAGRKFKLELAADPIKRFRGLSGRTEIPEDGGMLFVFPRPARQNFVMRDCPVPIDIIYLDGAGRVVAMHKMVPEPRLDDEKENDIKPPAGAPESWGSNTKYEERLTKYPSRFDSQFVIELKGNSLDALKLKTGDKVEIDVVRLKKLAK